MMDQMWMQLLAVGLSDIDVHDKSGVLVGYWDGEDYGAAERVPGVICIEIVQRPAMVPFVGRHDACRDEKTRNARCSPHSRTHTRGSS